MAAKITWFRVDCSIRSNPKVNELLSNSGGSRALNVYIFGLSYCAEFRTDGFISPAALHAIHATRWQAKRLVQFGLWEDVPGGWLVHDYADYQPSDAESQARSQRARAAAEARWSQHPGKPDWDMQ
jgi:hypothetical protein